MVDFSPHERVAHIVGARSIETVDVLGPTIQFLTPPEDGPPCIMRGTIPPGVVVPLHSHADCETFVVISGEVEGLACSAEGFRWLRIGPGDVFHVPGWAKHAFRNRTQRPAVMIVVTTSRMARFFQEVGRPISAEAPPSGPPPDEMIRHFLKTAERYGYWNATLEENEQVGLSLPPV